MQGCRTDRDFSRMERMTESAGMERKMTHNHSDEVNRILKRKSDACSEFLSATMLLRKALEAEEMTTVVGLIERRTALIGTVDGLDREIAHYQITGPYDQDRETARRIAAISADLREKFRQMLSANRDCKAVASERLSLLQKELLVIHEKEEGLHGYNGHIERIPRFLSVRT
jgi:hypothetical protein